MTYLRSGDTLDKKIYSVTQTLQVNLTLKCNSKIISFSYKPFKSGV